MFNDLFSEQEIDAQGGCLLYTLALLANFVFFGLVVFIGALILKDVAGL